MKKETVLLFVRHGLTTIAGVLVSAGAISPTQQDQFVAIGAGIAMFVIGTVWSWFRKRNRQLAAITPETNQ